MDELGGPILKQGEDEEDVGKHGGCTSKIFSTCQQEVGIVVGAARLSNAGGVSSARDEGALLTTLLHTSRWGRLRMHVGQFALPLPQTPGDRSPNMRVLGSGLGG